MADSHESRGGRGGYVDVALIGNGYYSRRIINTIVQAYNYAPNDVEFTATAGTHFGDDLGDVKVFLYGDTCVLGFGQDGLPDLLHIRL